MNELLNNEALGVISIQFALSKKQRMNIANVYLIAPLLFDKKICGYLKNKKVTVVSAQDIITSRNDLFIGFNDKFTDSLVVSTNSILMGIELGIFELQNNEIKLSESEATNNKVLGKKLAGMLQAVENLSIMLSEPPASIYSLLRIKI